MKNKFLFFLVTFIALVLVACSGGEDGTTSGDSGNETGDGASQEAKILTIAQPNDLETMDPQAVSATSSDRIFKNMYSYMFYWDENVELQQDLVVDYEQIDDETWRFEIRDDVEFHNGDPLTAEDIKFTLERVMTDSSLKQFLYFKQLKEVNVIDDYEIEIVTDGIMTTLLTLLAKSGAEILPKNYIEEVGIEEFQNNPVGSGPYKYVEWQKDSHVTLERNDNYYDGTPKWDEVTFKAIPESSTRVGELINGGVDIITDVPLNERERLEADADTKSIPGETTRVMLLIVRMTEGTVTADPKVREAIELAIDNKSIAESLYEGEAVPVRTRVPNKVFGSDPDLYDNYIYDPDRAKELLKEAGYEDGVEITLTASKGRYPFDGEVAEMIAAMLGEVGIVANLELLDGTAFSDVYANGTNEELLMIALADGLLDGSYSLTHYTKDRAEGQTDFYHEEAEELYWTAISNPDDEERAAQYRAIQQIAAEERPHIFLLQLPVNYGVRANVEFNPQIYEYFFVDDIDKN